MLIYLNIKIPYLQIAHQGGILEVGNIKIHLFIGLLSTDIKRTSSTGLSLQLNDAVSRNALVSCYEGQ